MNYGPIEHGQRSQLVALLGEAFAVAPELAERWIERSSLSDWRGLSDSDNILTSCLVAISSGQWYSGRAVEMEGLAGVAVSIPQRSSGAGKELIQGFLADCSRRNVPLSVLYGSTTGFYRTLGYERAGSVFEARVRIRELPKVSSQCELRNLTWGEFGADLKALHEAHARSTGNLVRRTYLWERVRQLGGNPAQLFGVFKDGNLVGYFFSLDEAGHFDDRTLRITDFLFTTPDSVNAFYRFLYSQRALFGMAIWNCHPSSPLLLRLRDRWNWELKLHENWMLRIINLVEAIQQRGYPTGVEGSVSLEVTDPVLSSNNGQWVLRLKNGVASLTPGGKCDVTLDIGAMAALYTGFVSPEELHLAGRLTGTKEAFDMLRSTFQEQAKLTELF